jgi:ABC-type uncharacterized transport system YnjBCD ATPase subunit/transposase
MDARLPPGSVGSGGCTHLLGTDAQARDVLSPIFWGLRALLFVGAAAGVVALCIGTSVGLVGGSGCGKATRGRVAAGLLLTEGCPLLDGAPVADDADGRAADRNTAVQTILQDLLASLNPRKRVGEAIAESPAAHRLTDRARMRETVAAVLQRVGLDPAFAARYPHQLSCRKRARIGIARDDRGRALARPPASVILSAAGREFLAARSTARLSFPSALMLPKLPPAKELIADRGYDSARFRAELAHRGIAACIPSTCSRKHPIPHDVMHYRQRHRIETMFTRLKDCTAPGSLDTRLHYAARLRLVSRRAARASRGLR